MDPVVTYEALCALREPAGRGAPELRRAWVTIDRALRSFVQRGPTGGSADKEDARQIALLGTLRHVHTMRAENPGAAMAWLETIYTNKLRDILRAQRRRRELLGQGGGDERVPVVETLAAPETIDPRVHDPAVLEPLEEALFEAVERFLHSKRPMHRQAAFMNAQLAYRRWAKEAPLDAVHAELADVSRETLYQRLRRGRVDVLLPAIAAWRKGLPTEGAEHAFALTLETILKEADRADAGQPRPERRKKPEGAVSPADHWKSAQCDHAGEGDDD